MNANKLFHHGLSGLGLTLPEETIDQLCVYLDELQKWNKKINLVGKAPPDILIETHFLDSLTLLPLVKNCPEPGLMDIGSGPGFPGLALKIALPELPIKLVEPRGKRCAFIRQIIRILGLKKISVLEARLEKDSPNLAEFHNAMPVLTSRAFTSVDRFLELAEPFCSPGGKVICMKGPKAVDEIAKWQQASQDSPFILIETRETILPFGKAQRKLLVFTRKNGSTSSRNGC